MKECLELHKIFNKLPRFIYPYDEKCIPQNGIYIIFEKGETFEGMDRIVRIGTHRGNDNLRPRLNEHFVKENKDRSIFRKNIGRAILKRDNDPFFSEWQLDLTSANNRKTLESSIDMNKQKQVEASVSEYLRNNCSFCVIEVKDKDQRLYLESAMIGTLHSEETFKSSDTWLGKFSSEKRISDSGLWLVQGLNTTPLSLSEIERIFYHELSLGV